MKSIILITLVSTFALSGFYNDDNSESKSEYTENERLCKIFTKKVDEYKKSIRDDVLAAASLASYEHRAEIFCKKAEDAKKEEEAKKAL
jgi:hypothetical protein